MRPLHRPRYRKSGGVLASLLAYYPSLFFRILSLFHE